jgi:adenylosuccinate synthase
MLRQANRLNGFTAICLTKLDVLTGLKKLEVCVGYKLGGKTIIDFSFGSEDFAKARPVYQEFSGWTEDISKVRKFSRLPKSCQKYVNFIEKNLGVKIKYISVGAERKSLISR